MKGKKADNEFVSQYISQCLLENKLSQYEIYEKAQNEIVEIDQKIKEAEELKKKRSKLLDVVERFSDEKKCKKEIDILKLFNITNKSLCQVIWHTIAQQELLQGNNFINYLMSLGYLKNAIKFALKELEDNQVVVKVLTNEFVSDDKAFSFIRGNNFDTYFKYVINGEKI